MKNIVSKFWKRVVYQNLNKVPKVFKFSFEKSCFQNFGYLPNRINLLLNLKWTNSLSSCPEEIKLFSTLIPLWKLTFLHALENVESYLVLHSLFSSSKASSSCLLVVCLGLLSTIWPFISMWSYTSLSNRSRSSLNDEYLNN